MHLLEVYPTEKIGFKTAYLKPHLRILCRHPPWKLLQDKCISTSGNAFVLQQLPRWVSAQYPQMRLQIGGFETDLLSRIYLKEVHVSVSSGEELLEVSSLELQYGIDSRINPILQLQR